MIIKIIRGRGHNFYEIIDKGIIFNFNFVLLLFFEISQCN